MQIYQKVYENSLIPLPLQIKIFLLKIQERATFKVTIFIVKVGQDN